MPDEIAQGGKYNITIFQGGSFARTFKRYEADGATPKPLTGYTTGFCEIRNRPGGSLIATMDVDLVEGDESTPGAVTISMTAEDTAALGASGFYDVLLVHENGVDRMYLVQGSVLIDRRVTVPEE